MATSRAPTQSTLQCLMQRRTRQRCSPATAQSTATEDHPAVTRIPAALGAFATQPSGADEAAGSGKWCCGALDALQPDGSVVTSFGLEHWRCASSWLHGQGMQSQHVVAVYGVHPSNP